MLPIIKDGQKISYSFNEINTIPSLSIIRGEPSPGRTAYRRATEFTVLDKTQNIYIFLEDLSHDFDIYLAHENHTKFADGRIILEQCIANSTNYGTETESIFARLKPGKYYIDIRKNTNSLDNTPPENFNFNLTFDSSIFDSSRAKLPNDTLLNQQWHLFNGGALSIIDNSQISGIQLNANNDGILPNADIVAPEAWKINHSAKDIVVAIVDDGVDIDHPDLKNNIWINKKEMNGSSNNDDDNNNYTDDIYGWNFATNSPNPRPYNASFSHGTHVAGTVGAEGNNNIGVTGVAWDVQLMALNVIDPETGSFVGADEALIYAAQNDADIVNMSFGFNLKINPADLMIYSQSDGKATEDAPTDYKLLLNYFHSILTQLKNEDVLAVIAAGNEGGVDTMTSIYWEQAGNLDQGLSPYAYAALFFDNALTISASDGMMNLSPYTNTGLTVDLAAPGGNITSGNKLGILSTYPMGGAKESDLGFTILEGDYGAVDYGYAQGTSMAAPVVSGAAALVKATNPSLSASDIREILMFSADRNPKLESLAGLEGLQLNLKRALEVAQEWKDPRDLFDFKKGTAEDDILRSGSEPAWYRGRKGNDVITGSQKNDRLYGNKGDDILVPGEGFDIVKGGNGQDVVLYNHAEESPIARPDRVFMKAEDRLDLSAIDGNDSKPGNQRLRLIETATFNGISGELLARQNGVFADLNGDAYADFGILFGKPLSFDLTSDHFIL